MDRTQKNIRLLAVFAYFVLAVSLFVGISYAALIMIGLLVAAIVLAKQTEDSNAILPVAGAGVLYFGVGLLQVVFNCLVRIVVRIEKWSDVYFDPFSETLTEIFEVITFLVMVTVVVFAVIAVLDIIKGKDFSKTLVGKIAAPFAMTKEVYYCANCGSAVKGDFCAKCGTKKPE